MRLERYKPMQTLATTHPSRRFILPDGAPYLKNMAALWALRHATPTRVTVFLALSPVTAAGLGALLLGEAISAEALLGLACVALGLALAHWRERAVEPPRTSA